jgi:CheY-like chemotaxis protein
LARDICRQTVSDETATTSRAQTFVEEALRWPLGDAGDALLDAGAARDIPGGGAAHDARAERRRVLLAEDNADLRDYLSRLVADHGYEVEATADGQAALTALCAQRPDILMTDVMMPKLDGVGLLAAVREDVSLRDLPIAMLSARGLLARVAANIAMARLRRLWAVIA